MALVHTQLYKEPRFDRIDMASHVRRLVDYFSQVQLGKGLSITTVIEPSDVQLTVNQAILCALVMNELVSNVFKHAFRAGQQDNVQVSVGQTGDDTVFIKVKDDGIGLSEKVDIDSAKSRIWFKTKITSHPAFWGGPHAQFDLGNGH